MAMQMLLKSALRQQSANLRPVACGGLAHRSFASGVPAPLHEDDAPKNNAEAFGELASNNTWTKKLTQHLKDVDPELAGHLQNEKKRQWTGLELIPSENFTSQRVLDAQSSVMGNKYSEGYPGARYYGGNEHIDEVERLCQKRALEVFRLDPEIWGCNVQAHSGTPANFAVYSALLDTHDRLMGLDLPHGGHLSHGFQTPTKKISLVSRYFETMPYKLDESTGLVDMDQLATSASLFRPKLIIAGTSAYARVLDYKRFREIADSVGAYLHADMAHIAGLVAAGEHPSPFDYADVVTTTTHKTLQGPRGAIIFYKKELGDSINQALFPGLQGGPHNHTIAALAAALKFAQSDDFKSYQKQVLANTQALADEFLKLGHTLVSGGTDNHLLLLDLRPKGVTGAAAERVLEMCHIAVNKNTVPGDKSALVPNGLRMGAPALTARGFTEEDFREVARLVDACVGVTKEVRETAESKKLKDFKKNLGADYESAAKKWPKLEPIRDRVEKLAQKRPTIGFDFAELEK